MPVPDPSGISLRVYLLQYHIYVCTSICPANPRGTLVPVSAPLDHIWPTHDLNRELQCYREVENEASSAVLGALQATMTTFRGQVGSSEVFKMTYHVAIFLDVSCIVTVLGAL